APPPRAPPPQGPLPELFRGLIGERLSEPAAFIARARGIEAGGGPPALAERVLAFGHGATQLRTPNPFRANERGGAAARFDPPRTRDERGRSLEGGQARVRRVAGHPALGARGHAPPPHRRGGPPADEVLRPLLAQS